MLLLATTLFLAAPQGDTVVVTGTVIDALGQPVPAAEVWIEPAFDAPIELARGRTDGEGVFFLGMKSAPNLLKVHARAVGTLQGFAWLSVATAVAPRTIRLFAGTTLQGSVSDAEGRGVAGAIVAVGPRREIGMNIGNVQTVTDEQGRYELPHAPLGEVWISAWAPGRLTTARKAFVTPGEVQDLSFMADPPRPLTIAWDGLPGDVSPVGFRVRLSHSSGPDRVLPRELRHGVIGPDGTLRIEGLPIDQSYHLHVTDPAGRWQGRAHWGKNDGVEPVLVFMKEGTPLEWSVKLAGPDGPLTGISLRLSVGGAVAVVVTDDDGRAHIENAAAHYKGVGARIIDSERWVLQMRAQHDEEDGPAFSGPSTNEVTLRAIPAASLRGILIRENGEPLAQRRVVLEEWDGSRLPKWVAIARGRTTDDGSFAIAGLYPESPPLRLRVASTRSLVAVDPLASGETTDMGRIEAAPAGTIAGIVRDRAGDPVPGARVFLMQIHDREGRDQVEVLADAGGRFWFSPAAEGTWITSLYWQRKGSGLERVGEPLEVVAGETVEAELQTDKR